MSIKVKCKLRGHEKFIIREGWITKGIDEVHKNPRIFLNGDGTDLLGVGNNMVKSIRYWLKAFGLISEVPGRGATLTDFGRIIYNYDLYIEDMFTLWILHSTIIKNIEVATIWNLFFMNCETDELNKEEIIIIMEKEYENYIETNGYSKKSLKDDIDVLLKMYSQENEIKYDPEDKNRCPFSELELITNKHGKYSKTQPNLKKLNYWVIIFELGQLFANRDTISIDELESNYIGKIYNLSRININDYLDKIEQLGYIKIVRTAGLDSVYKTSKMLQPEQLLEKYYTDRI